MTENKAIERIKYRMYTVGQVAGEGGMEDLEMAVKALEEIQQYRAIEKELKERYHANVDIPLLMHHFIETVFEGEKHEGFCLLTNEEAKAWDEYKSIGTPEECRAAMEKQTAYDPDKVVEQLEKLKSLVPVNRVLDDIVNDKPKELGMLIAYEKAIEIVKGGGVDG